MHIYCTKTVRTFLIEVKLKAVLYFVKTTSVKFIRFALFRKVLQ